MKHSIGLSCLAAALLATTSASFANPRDIPPEDRQQDLGGDITYVPEMSYPDSNETDPWVIDNRTGEAANCNTQPQKCRELLERKDRDAGSSSASSSSSGSASGGGSSSSSGGGSSSSGSASSGGESSGGSAPSSGGGGGGDDSSESSMSTDGTQGPKLRRMKRALDSDPATATLNNPPGTGGQPSGMTAPDVNTQNPAQPTMPSAGTAPKVKVPNTGRPIQRQPQLRQRVP